MIKRSTKYIIYSIVLLLVLTLSVGFSAFQKQLLIDDSIFNVRLQVDTRVSGNSVQKISGNAVSNSEDYNVKKIYGNVTFPTTSSYVLYKVDLTNYGNVKTGLLNITSNSTGINYSICDSNGSNCTSDPKTSVCNGNSCTLGSTKTIYVKVTSTSTGTKNVDLDLEFAPIHTITYENFNENTTSFKTDIMEGETYEVTLTSSPEEVSGTNATANYNSSNNKLTITNVSNDATITAKYLLTDVVEESYVGSDPNNYVLYDTDLYRIITKVTIDDGYGNEELRTKITKDSSIGEYIFDTYINNFDLSDIKEELNTTYYNSLSNIQKGLVDTTLWDYSDGTTIANIGLIHTNDFYDNSSWLNKNQFTIIPGENDIIFNNSTGKYIRISSDSNKRYNVKKVASAFKVKTIVNGSITDVSSDTLMDTYPTLYLTKDALVIGGSGTRSNPYLLEKKSDGLQPNPTKIKGRTLTVTGSSQQLVTVENQLGTPRYSTTTQLNTSNYSSSGSTTIPTASEVGNYTIYYYIPAMEGIKAKSGTVHTEIKGITYTINYNMGNNVRSIGLSNGSCTTTGVSMTCSVTLPSIVPNSGWTNGKWTDGTNEYDPYTNYTLSSSNNNITLTANANSRTYTVAFNSNGGTGGQSTNVTAIYGQPMPAINTTPPTMSGYTFMGWYDNQVYTSGTQYYTAAGASARNYDKTGGTTLYAGWKINNPATPTISGSGTYVFGSGAQLTCSTSTTYASGTTLYYSFGYTTTDGGSPSNWTTANTTSTYTAPASYTTRYYSCRVYAKNTTLSQTSNTITSDTTADAQITYVNARIDFDATTNGGTISGTTPLYARYGNANTYTTRTGTTTRTRPTATKTGWTFDGWYTSATGGDKVIAVDGTVQPSVSGWTNESGKFILTEVTDLQNVHRLYAQFTINDPATPTISGSGTFVYGRHNTLTCTNSTSYDSGTAIYYSFGYSTTDGGTPSNWTTPSTGSMTSGSYEPPSSYTTRYYSCRIYANNTTLSQTSSTVTSASSDDAQVTYVNARLDFDSNGGSLSGTSPVYVRFQNSNFYTTRTESTLATLPLSEKTGWTFTGWYTSTANNAEKVIDPDGTISAEVTGWTNASNKFILTSTSDTEGTNTLYAKFSGNTYTATFYYNSNTTPGGLTVATATSSCTVTSGTSCTVSIPQVVRNSVGKYNSVYKDVSKYTSSMGNSLLTISADTTFYTNYSSPITVYYPNISDGISSSNTALYRNEYFTGTTAMAAITSNSKNSKDQATSITLSNIKGTFQGLETSTGTYSNKYAVNNTTNVINSNRTTYYAVTTGSETVTFRYNNNTTCGSTTLTNNTSTTVTSTFYCSSTTTMGTSHGTTTTVPTAVSNSKGQYNSNYRAVANINSLTPVTTFTGGSTYYAIYSSSVTNYYYSSSYTNRTVYRNEYLASSSATSYTSVISTANNSTSNYTTSGGPGSSAWVGLADTNTATVKYSSVANAATSNTCTTTLYSIYQFSINYEKGSNVSAIGKTSDVCNINHNTTSCTVVLPTITPNTGYTSVGWSTTNGDTTGTAAGSNYTLSNNSTIPKLYANAVQANYLNTTTNNSYTTLNAAFGAVASNQTIKVMQNTTETTAATLNSGKTGIKLDLNGKTINMGTLYIKNNGTLDIYNTSNTIGKIESSSSAVSSITVDNYGTLTLNGTSSNNPILLKNESSSSNIYTIKNEKNSSLIVNNNVQLEVRDLGSSTNCFALYNSSNATMTLNGGSISGESGIGSSGFLTISSSSVSITTNKLPVSNGGVAVISAGTFTGGNSGIGNTGTLTISGSPSITGNTYYGISNQGTATISGGTIVGYMYGINNNKLTSVYSDTTITGGTIRGITDHGINIISGTTLTLGTDDSTVGTSSPLIETSSTSNKYGIYNESGGTFNFYDGIIKSSSGTNYAIRGTVSDTPTGYTVYKETTSGVESAYLVSNYLNTTTGVSYETLNDAFSAVANNQTIKVLQNTTETTRATLASGKTGVKLDLNGKIVNSLTDGVIVNQGGLDIYNSSSNDGKIESSHDYFTVDNSGTLTLNGTSNTNTIIISNISNGSDYKSSIRNSASKSVVINDNAQIISQYGAGINNDGIISVLGGTISGAKYGIKNNTGEVNITGSNTQIIGTDASSKGIFNSGTVTITGGTISSPGEAIRNNSVLTLGTNDSNVSTSIPLIQSANTSSSYCINNNDGTLNFYDGIIKSSHGTGYAIKGTVSDIPDDYVIKKETIGGIENAYLEKISILMESTMSYLYTAPYLRTSIARQDIESLTFSNSLGNHIVNGTDCWDVSRDEDGTVLAWVTDSDSNGKYEMTIGANGTIYASSGQYLFQHLTNLNSLNGINNLDTSNVTTMEYMFYDTGYNSTSFTLDLGNSFNVTNVTDMSGMFNGTGFNSPVFTLNLGDNFDTKNVEDMGGMFNGTGRNSLAFTLNLGDNFDTSKVTNMHSMFASAGYSNTNFTLDLGNKFDTSNVEDMAYMFDETGYNSTVFTLNLGSNFDTSKVTDMMRMFSSVGYNNTNFTLNLGSNFDTSNVESTRLMFYRIGYNSAPFALDLGSKFNTSSVTDMRSMFYEARYLKTIYVSSDFNTTSLNQSTNMFYRCTSLVGGAGTAFDSNHIDATYAHIDGGTSNPGYFTYKEPPVTLNNISNNIFNGASNIANKINDIVKESKKTNN